MIDLKQINAFMTTCKIKKLVSLPRPSKNLLGKKILMSGLDTAHCKFSNTTEEKF